MNIRKRIFSFLLCLCMMIAMIPVTEAGATYSVNKVEITLTAPKTGKTPATTGTIDASASTYVKEVRWTGTLNYNGTFKGGVAYEARVLVEIKSDKDAIFSRLNNISCTVNGKAAEWLRSSGGENQLYVYYTFPKTKKTSTSKKKVGISSEKDLLKIRDNPEGSYYLKKDITIKTKNLQLFDGTGNGLAFSGTFDGRGHKIKNYTAGGTYKTYKNISLFGLVSGATIKNVTMSNVKISVKAKHGGAFASLVSYGSAKFNNVKVTGSIKVTGAEDDGVDSNDYAIAGISAFDGTFKKCTNSAKISANVTIEHDGLTSISGIGLSGTFKNCKNTANLTLKGHHGLYSGYGGIAGISLGGSTTDSGSGGEGSSKFVSCTNTGTIKQIALKCKHYSTYASAYTWVAGITGSASKMTDCHNKGKIISIDKTDYDEATAWVGGVAVIGGVKSSKCSNTGTVSVSTNYSGFHVAGVFTTVSSANQCYNTGKITAKGKHGVTTSDNSDDAAVGGVFGVAYGVVHECYNTGAVSSNKKILTGGIAAAFSASNKKSLYNCYNTGKISGKKGAYNIGAIAGNYSVPMKKMHTIRDNYSTSSNDLYGQSSYSWKDWTAIGKKVSSITFANCSTLSSKYWTYSSSKKRLILKNNKEK